MADPSNHEFLSLVAELRAAQKEFFRTRHPATLQRAKELERQVDQALKQLQSEPEKQGTMFQG